MKGRGKLLVAWAAFVLGAWPAPAADRIGKHVRIVLDVSGSMRSNDAGRLAVLSTLLLHDLAAPNPTLGDSFEILPFEQDWQWPDPSARPPVSRRRVTVGFERRDALVLSLAGLAYDSQKTYFYPGLVAAIDDLAQSPGGHRDIRTVVLVTDGVPEPETRDREASLIREVLIPRLAEYDIRLYVLAFSDEAVAQRSFLEAMVRGAGGRRFGEVFIDPSGSGLLAHMLTIFARSFGYAPDSVHELRGTVDLDLEAGGEPEKVAVVVHTPLPQPPRLDLAPPQGGGLNTPAGLVRGIEPGGAFSLVWVLSPDAGRYSLSTDVAQGSVAVLRPTRLELEVLPGIGFTQTELTLAEIPFALSVRVRSPLADLGDPGPVDLSFRAVGERLASPTPEGERHAWRGERGAPPAGAGKPTAEGRVYDIEVRFEENPRAAGEVYVGYLELEARRGEAIVGARLGDHAHRVEVHPFLAVAPLPAQAYVADRALERGEEGCTRFSLTLAGGRLPENGKPALALRAVLAPADPALFGHELRRALFTLDGVALSVEGRPGVEAGSWYKGRRLSRERFLGEHELCLRLGEPTRGDPSAPLEVPLAMTLLESPYDEFRVIDLFTAKILIAPPGLARWRPLIGLAGGLAFLAALLWYVRDRPNLPRDMVCATGRDRSALIPGVPGPSGWVHRLLGLVGERPLVSEDGQTVAWLRPERDALYRIRPAAGLTIADGVGRSLPLERGLAAVDVHHSYQLTGEHGRHVLRLEYAEG